MVSTDDPRLFAGSRLIDAIATEGLPIVDDVEIMIRPAVDDVGLALCSRSMRVRILQMEDSRAGRLVSAVSRLFPLLPKLAAATCSAFCLDQNPSLQWANTTSERMTGDSDNGPYGHLGD